jgi:hypothetical protein
MKRSVPSKTEQIEAIIYSTEYELTLKYEGRDESGSPEYSKVFTVTRKEIENYLKSHYHLENLPLVYSSNGLQDGLFIIRVTEGYLIYHQERGIRDLEYVAYSEDDAWKFYIDFILSVSGTGLKWA